MTAWQELSSRMSQSAESDRDESRQADQDPWASAPAPAVVAKRIIEGVFRKNVPAERIPLLTNAVHWAYGTTWGAVYGLVQGTVRAHPLGHGLLFGTGVWAASYAELVPMGLYEPPWEYPPTTLLKDLSYHLVYGTAVAAAYEALA